MTTITFDALAYFEKLKSAGVPEEQAKVQANALRGFAEIQDAKNLRELATKGDLRETELRLQKEIEKIRGEIKHSEHEMLKWLIGLLLTQSAVLVAIFALLK